MQHFFLKNAKFFITQNQYVSKNQFSAVQGAHKPPFMLHFLYGRDACHSHTLFLSFSHLLRESKNTGDPRDSARGSKATKVTFLGVTL